MASVNKVILVGNLGADPEVRYSADGRAICNVSLATTSSWKDKNSGDRREETEWHRLSFFGPNAENLAKYQKKGSTIFVEGKLKTNKYEKDGVEHYSTSVIVDSVQFLTSKASAEAAGAGQPASGQPASGRPPAGDRPLTSANPPSRQQAAARPAPAASAPAGGYAPHAHSEFAEDYIPFASSTPIFDMESKLDRRTRRHGAVLRGYGEF
jgi:single-strand DNA-binding protein